MVVHGGSTVSVKIHVIQRDRQKDSCGVGVKGFCSHMRFLRDVVILQRQTGPGPLIGQGLEGISLTFSFFAVIVYFEIKRILVLIHILNL